MFRFVVAGVATVTLFVFGMYLGLLTEGEPPYPHVRLADRASTLAQEPGSSLEGVKTALIPAAYVGVVEQAKAAQDVEAERVEAERVAAENAEAVRVSSQEPAQRAVSAPSPDGWTEWDWQAQCETGGNWQMQGSSYSGGLGFLNGSWDAYGGQEFASNAGLATREQQIIVAERIQDVPPVNGPGDPCTGW